jgi:Tol biopolymer transport system component
LDWQTKKIVPVDVPETFSVADPHQVRDQMVFPRHGDKQDRTSTLWMMKKDGSNLRQLTSPKFKKQLPAGTPLGDHDPKLSPDGKYVAVMRQVAKDNWHVVVVDTRTGEERDLSAGDAVDAVPEWSSDGRLLLFWHVNRKDHSKNGLYTMKPDGSSRKRVPLPRQFFYTMPAFFPGAGSGPEAKIIFTARKP